MAILRILCEEMAHLHLLSLPSRTKRGMPSEKIAIIDGRIKCPHFWQPVQGNWRTIWHFDRDTVYIYLSIHIICWKLYATPWVCLFSKLKQTR